MTAAWKEAVATMRACMRPLPAAVDCRDVFAAPPTFSMKWKVSDASGAFGGPFSSPGDGRPCIIDHKTLSAMLFHLWGAADRRPVCLHMNIQYLQQFELICTSTTTPSTHTHTHTDMNPLYLLFCVTPGRRLNGRDVETPPHLHVSLRSPENHARQKTKTDHCRTTGEWEAENAACDQQLALFHISSSDL